MGRLYVPLDVDYDQDDKILEAGHLAELLYIRSLAFAKRTLSDGRIRRSQVAVLAHGIPSPQRHVARLTQVGLWAADDDGWVIAAWSKRNRSSDEIKAATEQKKAAAVKANHERWHVGGRRSETCPHCDPIPIPHRTTNGSQIGSTKTEPETETESSSSGPESDTRPAEPPEDDPVVVEAWRRARLEEARRRDTEDEITDVDAYAQRIIDDLRSRRWAPTPRPEPAPPEPSPWANLPDARDAITAHTTPDDEVAAMPAELTQAGRHQARTNP